MKTFPVIYKKTSSGATQQWQQEVQGSKYRTISGQVNGKLVTTEWTQAEATNVGRANERSAEDQAIFEVEANYKKKLDKEYHENIADIDIAKIFKPMLAKVYGDYKTKLSGKVIFTQPKLDGMRCIATQQGLWTRNGKPILTCPHIEKVLEPYFKLNPFLILDGELYNHDYKDDFNSLMSMLKKQKPSKEDFELSEKYAQYHVYDLPSNKGVFSIRNKQLVQLLKDINSPYLKTVITKNVASGKDIDDHYIGFLDEGYEGLIVRVNAGYQNKRTDVLLKRKENISQEFELADLEEGIGNWAGYAKIAKLKLPDGRIFGAGVKGSQDYTKNLLDNRKNLIGTMCTVEYQALTPDGIPRFGRLKEFNRTDNTDED